MDHLIDLDVVAVQLEQRRESWTAAGLVVGDFTWRDATASWPQPIVTDRATVADPESLGVTFRGPVNQDGEVVFWTGGWADLSVLIHGEVVIEAPELADVRACVAVADGLVGRLLR